MWHVLRLIFLWFLVPDVANQIMEYIVNGSGKGQAYNRLALFTDTFGNRLVGSENLEKSIGEKSSETDV